MRFSLEIRCCAESLQIRFRLERAYFFFIFLRREKSRSELFISLWEMMPACHQLALFNCTIQTQSPEIVNPLK